MKARKPHWTRPTPGSILVAALLGAGMLYTYVGGMVTGRSTVPVPVTYTFVALSYLCIATCTWIEKDNLAEFHIDRSSLIALALSSFFLLRPRLGISREFVWLAVILLAGIWVLFVTITNWSRITKTSWRWVAIGVLLTGLLLLLGIAAEAIMPRFPLRAGPDSISRTITSLLSSIRYNLSFASTTEEFLFRGFLWGYLVQRGWSENKAMIFQAVLFWLAHPNAIFSSAPAYTLLIFPAEILIQSLLVRYSKQIFPSIVMHTIFNVLASLR